MPKATKSRQFDEKNSNSYGLSEQHCDDGSAQSPSYNTIEMRDAASEPSKVASATSLTASNSRDETVGQATAEANAQDETQPVATGTMSQKDGIATRFLQSINWMPPWCRYDPHNPPKFTLSMNILLAFVRNPYPFSVHMGSETSNVFNTNGL
jgi:hypothetical protein